VEFTAHLKKVAPNGPIEAGGSRIDEALAEVFVETPLLKTYILDDQGRLRKHVCIFLDGTRLIGAAALEAEISESSEIYVMQALSGG
jgi:sulfur-carrier protein